MQTLTTAMQTALAMRSATNLATINRQPVWLYEIYPADYHPAENGLFDPANAIGLFSEVGISWLGRDYRRQVGSRDAIERFFTEQINNVSLTFANADLYMSTFVLSNNLEGKRLIVRYIDVAQSATLADSLVVFVGRLEAPQRLNEEECLITSYQEVGSKNVEVPRRIFSATDPDGRSPADPLFKGFKFTPVAGLFQKPTTVTTRKFFFFVRQKTVLVDQQWSSQDNINEGDVIPTVLGRVQLELIPVLWADVGSNVKALWVAAGQRVSDIVSIASRSPGFFLTQITKHLGDPGGTGTNASPPVQFPTAGYLSDTAYIDAVAPGSTLESVDPAPTVTAIVLCSVDLPNSLGQFVLQGPTSNTALLARFVFCSADYLGLDPALIHNGELLETVAYCDEFILDQSNAEALVLGTNDAALLAAGQIQRISSSGVATSALFRSKIETNFIDPAASPIFIPDLAVPINGGGGGGGDEPPRVLGATGSGVTIEILFDVTLAASALSTAVFTVKKNGVAQTVSAANATGSKVVLTLAVSISTSDIVTVEYTGTVITSTTLIQADVFGPLPVTLGGRNTVPGIPVTPPLLRARRRYTYNAAIGEKIPAIDLLTKAIFPSSRLYSLTGPDGRLRIRAERPADSTNVFTDAAAGATTIKVGDVERWIASKQGLILIGPGLVSSETCQVTNAQYDPTFGNSVSVTVSATGTAGILASGGTFSGGTTSVPAQVQLTLNGTGDIRHPSWQNAQGVTKFLNGGIKDTADGDGWGTSGASTTRTIGLAQDGDFIFTPIQGTFVAGFTYSSNPLSYTDMEYAFQCNSVSSTELSVVLQGAAAIGLGRNWSPGDRLRINKTGTTIRFYHKEQLVHTATVPVTGTMRGGFVGFHNGSFLSECEMSPFPSGAINKGEVITVTINGVTVRYQVSDTDTVETIAGILAAYLGAAWALRSYIRASWDPADPTKVTLYCKQGTLTLNAALTNSHPAILPSPTAAPTIAGAAGGSLAAGDYTLAYAYQSAQGRTLIGPPATANITAGQKLSVTGPTAGSWPAGTSSLAWYMSKAPGDPNLVYLANNNGGTFDVNVVPDPNAPNPPVDNTSGQETIRVMASFTQENIRRGKFEWPLMDGDKGINQVLIKYREASMDFASRELYVNDYEHQKQINKINTLEIDGRGIDNFNQAWRIANTALSKEREGNFFCEWSTDEAGIIFEEGDVVCASDVSGGFVNIPLRIEKLTIQADGDAAFRARLYSTIMFSDDVGKHTISIPSSLKYLNSPPPAATNLVLTEVGGFGPDLSWQARIRGTFDFGAFPAGQLARIRLKEIAAGDTDFRAVDTVFPDANNVGSFEIRAVQFGDYEVEVITESVFGYKAASGHPIGSITISPPLDTIIKIFDNVPPKDSLEGLALTVGVCRATGTGAWHGAAGFRDRGYGYERWFNEITQEAVLGHTTNNSDTWLAATGGKVYFVIEGGNSITLSNATVTEITAGKNNYFVGREKIGVQTWTDLGGGLWKGENLIRGMNHTELFQDSHTAQEDMLQIDDNAFFIPIEYRDVGHALQLKILTFGQSLAGVTAINLTPRGDSVRPYVPAVIEILRDGANDWTIDALLFPRANEIPASLKVELWNSTSRTSPDTDRKATLIIPPAITVPVTALSVAAGKTGHGQISIGGGTYYKVSGTNKNNMQSGSWSNQALTTPWSRFDFNMHFSALEGQLGIFNPWADPSAAPVNQATPTGDYFHVYLWYGPPLNTPPGSVLLRFPVIGIKWSAGTVPGTIKENFYKYTAPTIGVGADVWTTTQTLVATRDNVDPGVGVFKIFDTDPADAGRPGPRYSFLVASNEIRVFAGTRSPGTIGQKPIAIVPFITKPTGDGTHQLQSLAWPFPLHLYVQASTGEAFACWCRDMVLGGSAAGSHRAIISAREQISLFGAVQTKLYLRLAQEGHDSIIGDGFPLDLETPIIT